MNLLPNLSSDSEVLSAKGITLALYCFLISDCKSSRGNIVLSAYDYEYTKEKFAAHGGDNIDNSFDELERIGVISFKGDLVIVGTKTATKAVLYKGESKVNPLKDLELVLQSANKWLKENSSLRRTAEINMVINSLEVLLTKNIMQWKTGDFVNLFKAVYETTYQEVHREFLKKEFGQMKILLNIYNPPILIKMLIEYISNVENYHRYPPTISSFMHYKDEIYIKLFGATKKVKNKDEDGF